MSLDFDAVYSVRGWSGIAFHALRFPQRWEAYVSSSVDENGEEYEHETGEGEYVDQDESCGEVIVAMVGDDRKYTVPIDDLTKLSEWDYCGSCGQIGCGHAMG